MKIVLAPKTIREARTSQEEILKINMYLLCKILRVLSLGDVLDQGGPTLALFLKGHQFTTFSYFHSQMKRLATF